MNVSRHASAFSFGVNRERRNGSAAAVAGALGMKDHVTKLKGIVSNIYGADEMTSPVSERMAKLVAKHEGASSTS